MTEMPEKYAKRDERFVDELLDSALAQYAQAEPRPGLEGRLLARLRSEPDPAAFGWRWLPMAAAAAVVFAAVLYFAGSRESPLATRLISRVMSRSSPPHCRSAVAARPISCGHAGCSRCVPPPS